LLNEAFSFVAVNLARGSDPLRHIKARFAVRYEAILAAAFIAGLCGAMSQQGVKPAVHHVETTLAQQSVAIPIASAPAPQAAPPQVAEAAQPAAVAPTVAPAPVTEPAKPVRHAHKPKKIAAKVPLKKQDVAEEHHSFWYRIFHNGNDKVATADDR
jgi:hypothetical protein